jgi:NADH dehydrogenase
MSRPRIVIVGGGFGGVYTARYLERLFRPGEAEICLVNRENYFVFQPLLPEVISGAISLLDVVSPIRRLCPRTRLYMREVESIDFARRTVLLAPGLRPRTLELPYDYLVIATGSVNDFSSMPGVAEHSLSFRTLGDALRVRNRAISAMEEADIETDAQFRRRLLTFVISGGGFSGVEVVAELNDFLRAIARHYPSIAPDEIRCILVHSGERILPEVSPRLAEYAQRVLERRGVTVRLKERVSAATADSVVLKSGEAIPARTLVATVPAGPAPLIHMLPCAKGRNRLVVNCNLEIEGFPDVWALGDCAAVSAQDRSAVPPTAQHATREARAVASNIRAAVDRRQPAAFSFAGLGKLGSLGHHSAIAEVMGMRFSGFLAWLLWRSVYLIKLPGIERRMRVGLDWAAALLFPTDLVQLSVQTSDNIANEHFEPGEFIFQEGDVGDRLYVIRAGEVEILRGGQRLALLGPGEYFGEMSLLSDLRRNASARATWRTDLLAIAKGDFTKLVATMPAFQSEIARSADSRRDQ